MTTTQETNVTLSKQGYVRNSHLGYLWGACAFCKLYTYHYYVSLLESERRRVERGAIGYKATHRTICEKCDKENS